MPTELDVAEFNLKAYTTVVELRIKMMEAYASYNLKMAQVAQQQLENARTILQITILQDAFADYMRARQQVMREVRDLDRQYDRFAVATTRLIHLVQGETVSTTQINAGWRGWYFLCQHVEVSTMIELVGKKCKAKDRLGSHYYSPYNPEDTPGDAPDNIKSSYQLMDWAKRKSLIPRLGSPPQEQLIALLSIINNAGIVLLAETKTNLASAEADLLRIREAHWERINVELETPKTEEA